MVIDHPHVTIGAFSGQHIIKLINIDYIRSFTKGLELGDYDNFSIDLKPLYLTNKIASTKNVVLPASFICSDIILRSTKVSGHHL
jgi:hypothetical protein